MADKLKGPRCIDAHKALERSMRKDMEEFKAAIIKGLGEQLALLEARIASLEGEGRVTSL